MNTEEWKSKMMDYLYDELDSAEKKEFEKELEKNADLREELQAFQEGKSIIGKLEEKEVSTPPFFNVYQGNSNNSGQRAYKWFLSIAASLLILLLAARFTGLQMIQKGDEFKIAFQANSSDENQIKKGDVEQLVKSALANYDQKIETRREQERSQFKNYLSEQSQLNRKVINNYMVELQKGNAELMQAYWQESTEQQQLYTEKLLTNFASYMEEQRKEDMDYLFAKMELMETDKDLFKIETGQLINSLANNQEVQQAY